MGDLVVRKFKAMSLANGEINVAPDWVPEPVDPDAAPVGVMTRMAVADWCQEVLNAALKTEKGRELEMTDD